MMSKADTVYDDIEVHNYNYITMVFYAFFLRSLEYWGGGYQVCLFSAICIVLLSSHTYVLSSIGYAVSHSDVIYKKWHFGTSYFGLFNTTPNKLCYIVYVVWNCVLSTIRMLIVFVYNYSLWGVNLVWRIQDMIRWVPDLYFRCELLLYNTLCLV